MPIDVSIVPSRKRAATLQAVGGYANTGISVIQGLVLMPMYIHYIGAHTYGLWLASGGILAWLSFVDMGISSMLVQRIASAYSQRDFSLVGAYFTNGMVISFCATLTLVLVGFGVSIWLPVLLNAAEMAGLLKQCFQLALIAVGLNIVNDNLRAFTQALLRPVYGVISLITCRLVGLAATIILLFHNFALWSIPVGLILTASTVFVLNAFYALRLFMGLGIRGSLSTEVLREYIRVSPALFSGRLGTTLVQQVEPLLITLMTVPEMATAYVVTKRVADVISQLLHVIIGASYPSFAHLIGSGDTTRIIQVSQHVLTLIYALGLVGFATYVAMNRSFVELWVGSQYCLNSQVVILIAAGMLVMVLHNALSRMLMALGEVAKSSLLVLIEAVVRVLIMVALFETVGISGIPLALLVSCGAFLTLYASIIAIKLPSAIVKITLFKAMVVAVVILYAALLIFEPIPRPDSWWLFVIYALCAVILFTIGTAILFPPVCRLAIRNRRRRYEETESRRNLN